MTDETLLGIIPDLNWRRGFLKYAHATLLVTNKRLVIALRPKERAKDPSGDVYRTLGPETALAETPGNLEIDLSHIRSFRVESGQALSADDAPHPDRLILKTEAGKEVFTFGTHSLSSKEAKTLLGSAMRQTAS
jgi:hypothetical protein